MSVALVRVGLATSLGSHAPSACAAIRAGIARPRPLEGVPAFDPEEPSDARVTGHPAYELTDGYEVPGRWLRLLNAAWTGTRPASTEAARGPTIAWLCIPSPQEPRFEDGLHPAAWFVSRARELLGGSAQKVVVVMEGAAGFWRSMAEASQRLLARECATAIVLAADSLLDSSSLAWLAANDRLKTPERPTGVAPGEAAACLVLERAGEVTVSGVSLASAEARDGTLAEARALVRALGTAVRAAPGPVGDVVGNQNGEYALAHAWGSAQAMLLAENVAFEGKEHFPAMSLGDVGMCAPAIGITLAAAAQQRRWASRGATTVWSLIGGCAGACLVSAKR